jgi:hypothetical protein
MRVDLAQNSQDALRGVSTPFLKNTPLHGAARPLHWAISIPIWCEVRSE